MTSHRMTLGQTRTTSTVFPAVDETSRLSTCKAHLASGMPGESKLRRHWSGRGKPDQCGHQAFGVRLPVPLGVTMEVQLPLGTNLNAFPCQSLVLVPAQVVPAPA